MIRFIVVPRNGSIPSNDVSAVYLRIDNWNDYSFVTMFQVSVFDERGKQHELGSVRIGFKGQTTAIPTYSTIEENFSELSDQYFSVGTDVEYYKLLSREISLEFRTAYLSSLRDVVRDETAMSAAKDERVFRISHLRSLSLATITEQFRRVLDGGTLLTDFAFRFTQDQKERTAGFQLSFDVKANSMPTTNIHAVIGRNGVGKTTLLNNMIRAVIAPDDGSRFESATQWFGHKPIKPDYFSALVSVSFSAFDPFNPPQEQADPSKGICYFYVGLKSYADDSGALLKSQNDLADELVESLKICLSEDARSGRWVEAIKNLESDDNFAEMALLQLRELHDEALDARIRKLLRKMSSGHAIVLLTITKLVARVDEKTLILFDEPESHLHPPLLSALIRSLSMLLTNRNAVAIIATHSPVVLQEIPRSCVWKITRTGLSADSQRPEIETFGENVGVLTREVFGLEVAKSGFNALLSIEASNADSYDNVIARFGDQLGFEARAILQSIMHRSGKQ